MRKNKVLVYVFTGIIIMLVVFYIFERQRYRNMIWNLVGERDSLLVLEYYREGKNLKYYGLSKDSVMKMLPEPEYDYVIMLDSNEMNYNDWKRRYFVIKYLKSIQDTIEVNIAKWRIPYHEIPNLYLGFIKKDNVWIVDDGVQWDDDTKVD